MTLVSIIVPTYNEAENIPTLLERIHKALNHINYEIIIVDDNSPDGTAEIAKKLSKKYPIKVIVRPGKLGLASAVIEGFKNASGKYIVVMDADLQHPPEFIPEMVKKLESGYDIVIASRYVKGGKDLGLSTWRKVVSWGARILAWLMLPKVRKVRDVMSGFFAVRREYVTIKTKLSGYKILLEVLTSHDNLKIIEIPYTFKPRSSGTSKLGVKEYINYIFDILKLSKYFTIKYIAIATIAAIIAKLTAPILGIAALIPSLLIRYACLRRELTPHGLIIAETSSTGLKQIFTIIGTWQILGTLGIIGWGIAALIELALIHVLR